MVLILGMKLTAMFSIYTILSFDRAKELHRAEYDCELSECIRYNRKHLIDPNSLAKIDQLKRKQ